jgi:hypothetical protein
MSHKHSNYAEDEYGLTIAQMEAVAQKLHGKAREARCGRKSKVFKGDIEALVKD